MPVAPELADALLVILRWLHGLATIIFLGWSAVLWLDGAPGPDTTAARRRFKDITELSLLVLLATGAILTFDRLSSGASTLYAVILVVKVACAVLAYQAAFRWRRHGLTIGATSGRVVLLAGLAAVLLAAVLNGVFERGLLSPS